MAEKIELPITVEVLQAFQANGTWDRGAFLEAMIRIELLLSELLAMRLREETKATKLSWQLSAKNSLAYRVGVISKGTFQAIKSLGSIRNKAAHQRDWNRALHEREVVVALQAVKDIEAFQDLSTKLGSKIDGLGALAVLVVICLERRVAVGVRRLDAVHDGLTLPHRE